MQKTVIKTKANTYFLRFTINAHCEAEEMLGFPLTELEGKTGISVFRTLMYIGLKHGGHRDITLEDAGDIMQEIIHDHGMEYLSEVVSKAVQQSISKQEDNHFKREQGEGKKKL